MRIIGHKLIAYEPFFVCKDSSEIKSRRQNIFEFDEAMIERAKKLEADFSLFAKNIVDIVLANAFGARFIVVPKELSKDASKIAQNYLFDAQIAVVIGDLSEIEGLVDDGVDVVILKEGIINGNF